MSEVSSTFQIPFAKKQEAPLLVQKQEAPVFVQKKDASLELYEELNAISEEIEQCRQKFLA